MTPQLRQPIADTNVERSGMQHPFSASQPELDAIFDWITERAVPDSSGPRRTPRVQTEVEEVEEAND